jgi:hypothetical protein
MLPSMTEATIKKINQKMKIFAVRAVQEVLSDPDFGLALTAKAKKRLKSARVLRGEKISFSKILKKYA